MAQRELLKFKNQNQTMRFVKHFCSRWWHLNLRFPSESEFSSVKGSFYSLSYCITLLIAINYLYWLRESTKHSEKVCLTCFCILGNFNLQIKLFNFNEQITKLFASQLSSIKSYFISNMIRKTIKNTKLNLRSYSLRTYKCRSIQNIQRGSRDKTDTKF